MYSLYNKAPCKKAKQNQSVNLCNYDLVQKNVLKHKESQTLELEWSTGLPSGTTTPSSSVLASDGFGAVLPTPFVLQPSELQIKFL